MDRHSFEPLEAVEQLKKGHSEGTRRAPLGPSEKHNARKPPTREIPSRYNSGITTRANSNTVAPRRCPSPDASRSCSTAGTYLPKRAQSAERKRPSTPQSAERKRPSTPSSKSRNPTPSSRSSRCSSPSSRFTTPVSDSNVEMRESSTRFLASRIPSELWPSIRGLSSSFQAESIPVADSKKGRAPIPNADGKKERVIASPDHALKSGVNVVAERKKTPLRANSSTYLVENLKPVENKYMRLVDQKMWPGTVTGKATSNDLLKSRDLSDKVSQDVSLLVPSRGISARRMPISGCLHLSRNEMVKKVPLHLNGGSEQETFLHSNASSFPVRTQCSPHPGLQRPSSPSRTFSTPIPISKVIQSPIRSRPSHPLSSSNHKTSQASAKPSILNYIVDVRKGKSMNHINDIHQLRLLCNRILQWRFVNAQALDALFVQKIRTENTLCNVWNNIADLRESVVLKWSRVQQLRQDINLAIILKEQMSYLEQWAALETEECSSLSGVIESLKASTLRLPITGAAKADVIAMKHAISLGVDVMQLIGSSICNLLPKVEGTNVIISELSSIAAQERAMLDECKELLASTSALEVQESSLKVQLIQLKQRDHKVC